MCVLCIVCAVTGCGRASARISPANRTDLLNYDKPLPALIRAARGNASTTSIKIEKSAYRLTILSRNLPIKSYPAVFGRNPVDDKLREGDGCTPEGSFRLDARYPHKVWDRFMRLNYPTVESWRRFRAAKQDGRLKPTATIGGFVGIHGTPDGQDEAIDRKINWTLGCISLKRADVEELYDAVRVGTPVTILH